MPYKDLEKQREYIRNHYRNNKKSYYDRHVIRRKTLKDKLFEYKTNLSCVNCGLNNPIVIDFHHKDDKTDTVSSILNKTMSWNKVLVEIQKCDPICVNCHRKLHKKERSNQKYLEDSDEPNQQYKRKLTRWFYQYKSTLKCELCEENDSCCLDFHHIENKIMIVGECAGHGWSKNRILKEINKCRVLCGNCHRIHHFNNRED